MKKLSMLIAGLTLVGCISTISLPSNVKVSESRIQSVEFDWDTNKNHERNLMCLKKHIPADMTIQSVPVIIADDKKNNEIIGQGSFAVRKSHVVYSDSSQVKFKFKLHEDGEKTKLTFTEVLSSYDGVEGREAYATNFSAVPVYTEAHADLIYDKLEQSAKAIQECK